MQVSCLLYAAQLSEEATTYFSQLRDVVDELVVVVPAEGAHPDLYPRLQELNARIFTNPSSSYYPSDSERRDMIAPCKGEWILVVDHDEELSPEWQDPRWRRILSDEEFTHFFLPRRWITPSGNFLDAEPWWPDWQMRLFRNDPDRLTFPMQLHDPLRFEGAGGYLRTLALHHHDLRLTSRIAREEKTASYSKLRRGHGLGFFYLFENYPVRESPLPPQRAFQLETEVLRMDTLTSREIQLVFLAVQPPPVKMRPGEIYWIDVEVTNGTNGPLCCGAPFPVNLSYHWFEYPSRNVAVFEGRRTAVLPELACGKTGRWQMLLAAPPEPGHYLLQVTIVQEHVRWLETANSNLAQEFVINVRDDTKELRSRPG